MNTNTIVRERIRLLRKLKGLSSNEIAEKLHMDTRSYQRIESGEKKSLDILLLQEIAILIGVEIKDLFSDDSAPVTTAGYCKEMVALDVNRDNKHHYEKTVSDLLLVIHMKDKIIEDLKFIINNGRH